MTAQKTLDEIKNELILIKKHWGHIDGYDSKLFELFIKSYRENYMDFSSEPRLTADEILSYLAQDSEYQNCISKSDYKLEEAFRNKWHYWTEAYQKGLSSHKIEWVNQSEFDRIEYEQLPLGRDMFLVGDQYIESYHDEWKKFFIDNKHDPSVGYNGLPIQVNEIKTNKLLLSLFLFSRDRYHETIIELPKEEFISCWEIRKYDNQPCIFVNRHWLKTFSENQFACYGLIDESNYSKNFQLSSGHKDLLNKKQEIIKKLSKKYPNVLFAIFSDSILLKFSWFIDEYNLYTPEILISVFQEIEKFYHEHFLSCYGIFIQGINPSLDNNLFCHGQNWIDLNLNGSAFGDLFCIDNTVRSNIKKEIHEPGKMYFDESLFLSLKINNEEKEVLKKSRFKYSSSINNNHLFYITVQDSLICGSFKINTPIVQNKKASFLKRLYAYFVKPS